MTTDVYILTGFLGSGKTSLLKRFLGEERSNTALIVNEFGEIGIDNLILQSVSDDTVLLPNGCLCCSVNGDLLAAIENLASVAISRNSQPLDRIVIETTGLASPGPIIATVAQAAKTVDIRLAGVIAVVDAYHAASQSDEHTEWLEQVTAADAIAVSKTDLVEPADHEIVFKHVRKLNPTAALSTTRDSAFLKTLFEGAVARSFKLQLMTTKTSTHHTHTNAQTLSLFLPHAIDWHRFSLWLMLMTKHHGKDILRMKSVFKDVEHQRFFIIHGVQEQIYPPEPFESENQLPGSQIVLITKNLDVDAIEKSLRYFLSPDLTS